MQQECYKAFWEKYLHHVIPIFRNFEEPRENVITSLCAEVVEIQIYNNFLCKILIEVKVVLNPYWKQD